MRAILLAAMILLALAAVAPDASACTGIRNPDGFVVCVIPQPLNLSHPVCWDVENPYAVPFSSADCPLVL
jgi:hypothetical protein